MSIQVNINVCRVCLGDKQGDSLLNDQGLLNKFVCLTQLQVKSDDSMPSKICEKCVVRLKIAYDFRQLAIASDIHLRTFVRQINKDFKSVRHTLPAKKQKLSEDEMRVIAEEGYDLKAEDPVEEMFEEILAVDIDAPGKQEEEEDPVFEEDNLKFYDDEDGDDEQQEWVEEQIESVLASDTEEADNGEESPQVQKRATLPKHKTNQEDEDRPFKCFECDKAFAQRSTLKQHTYIHTGERPYKCKICSKAFTQSKTLKHHMRRHTGEKPFPCESCELHFRTKDALKYHIFVRHSGIEREPHGCMVCFKNLKTKYSLQTHLRMHLKKKECFQCDTCPEIFVNESTFEAHKDEEKCQTTASWSDLKSGSAKMASASKNARKSYTAQEKLNIIAEYKPKEFGFIKLSNEFGIPVVNLKRWYHQREELTKLVNDSDLSVKDPRRLTGGGRKAQVNELDDPIKLNHELRFE